MLRCLFWALVIIFGAASPGSSADTWEWIIPGVQHLHRVTATPWEIHVIKADLTNPRVRVRAIIKNDNDYPDAGETTSSMAQRYRAVAAINTDYFCAVQSACPNVWHCPQGYTVTEGLNQLPPGYSSPINPSRTTFQISQPQDQVLIDVVASPQAWWHNVTAGGPRTVRNGVVSVESEPDIPDQVSRQPRTGCAISADGGTLIVATVDGRQPGWSVGMTAAELAGLLIEMGGYQGMSFDGGGSTTMVINGSVANRPSDGSERKVAAALAIIDAFAQPSSPSCWLDTGFENPPYAPGPISGVDGWVTEQGTAAVYPVSGGLTSQGLTLTDGAAYRTVTACPVGGVQWLDFNVRASQTPVDATFEAGCTPGTDAAIVALRPNGKLSYFEGDRNGGGTWKDLSTYFANKWYRLSVRLDYTNQSYAFYLNGYLRASGIAFRDASAGSGLRSVRFTDSTGAGGQFYVDDVYAGNVDPWFPRVSPNTARVIVPGPKQFQLVNGPAAGWQVVDERNPQGNPVAAGTIATIDGSGRLAALSAGSCRVEATDAVGKTDQSSTVQIVAGETVAAARGKSLGSSADVSELVVTGVFAGCFYCQALDRSAGVVVQSSVPVALNQRVAVAGQISLMSGEIAIAATWVEVTGSVPAPTPLGLLCRDIARQNPAGPSATTGGSVAALLVRTAGRVSSVESGRFFLDDGSGPPIAVIYTGLLGSDVGRFVAATGLVAASDGSPAVRTRGSGDVIIVP